MGEGIRGVKGGGGGGGKCGGKHPEDNIYTTTLSVH